MNLHTCTIVLKDNHTLKCDNVEQSLGVIERHGISGINKISIDATDGQIVHSYNNLSIEESIESLMDL
ncbi:hypothetical protein ACODM8_15695 [Vibrio ostreicida]|uniref:HMA domain-containing protein n=1 Tax=Vibrio ostreicida TaxID=526588 RepID=A0ABT8BYN1_9VIBR|nr:hypothetical protein [Vibrio ostreicida]MDN3612138.1 hypothetical protein [Vibrio ostreicida]NPD08537.1 hypothetical protein [Vibrio ostreicida]